METWEILPHRGVTNIRQLGKYPYIRSKDFPNAYTPLQTIKKNGNLLISEYFLVDRNRSGKACNIAKPLDIGKTGMAREGCNPCVKIQRLIASYYGKSVKTPENTDFITFSVVSGKCVYYSGGVGG